MQVVSTLDSVKVLLGVNCADHRHFFLYVSLLVRLLAVQVFLADVGLCHADRYLVVLFEVQLRWLQVHFKVFA